MIIDSRLEFSNAQALTATADSTNVIDLSGDFDVGKGVPLYVVVRVIVALDGTTGDETYTVTLETGATAAAGTDLTTVTMARGDAAGTTYIIAVPQEVNRYLQLYYTLGGTTPTGTVDAWVTPFPPENWAAFADASN